MSDNTNNIIEKTIINRFDRTEKNKNSVIDNETLQEYSVDSILTDEENRTLWINGMPFGNAYIHFAGESVSDTQPTHAEIFNDFDNNIALGDYSHAEGYKNKTAATYSHVEGQKNIINSDPNDNAQASHAEGRENTINNAPNSHVEGKGNTIETNGREAHVEGYGNTATAQAAHAEGMGTIAMGKGAHAEGIDVAAVGKASHAEGNSAKSIKDVLDAETLEQLSKIDELETDQVTDIKKDIETAWTNEKNAEGNIERKTFSAAIGIFSHTEGLDNLVNGACSHAEGQRNLVTGGDAHAEGKFNTVRGNRAHAEGYETTSSGHAAHSEGCKTKATGYESHAEGYGSEASGCGSHAEGGYFISESINGIGGKASGKASHAEGIGTIANNDAEHASGKYNVSTKDSTIFSVGIGEDDNNRKNAVDIIKKQSGNDYITTVHTDLNIANDKIVTIGDPSEYSGDNINIDSTKLRVAGGIYIDGDLVTTGTHYIVDVQTDTAEELHVKGQSQLDGNTTIGDGETQADLKVLKGTTKLNGATEINGDLTVIGRTAFGINTLAEGDHSHAEGDASASYGGASHAEGYCTIAHGGSSHAEGNETIAIGTDSHAEGIHTVAAGYQAHAEGHSSMSLTDVSGENIISVLSGMYTNGDNVPSQQIKDDIIRDWNVTRDDNSDLTFQMAFGSYSHVEGLNNLVTGNCAHGEGQLNHADGNNSHTEGKGNRAVGNSSHAEGSNSIADGSASHAEGIETTARGEASHSEGIGTNANEDYSHAEGYYSSARGYASHAEGMCTITTNDAEHASGKYNVSTNDSTIFSVGIGTEETPANAIEITTSGDIYIGADSNKNNPCNYPGDDKRTLQSLIVNQDLEEVTYESLYSRRNSGELKPGKFYRIVDYITTTTQENTVSAGYQFDIIVLALSKNTLSEDAWAVQHDFDKKDEEGNDISYNINICQLEDMDETGMCKLKTPKTSDGTLRFTSSIQYFTSPGKPNFTTGLITDNITLESVNNEGVLSFKSKYFNADITGYERTTSTGIFNQGIQFDPTVGHNNYITIRGVYIPNIGLNYGQWDKYNQICIGDVNGYLYMVTVGPVSSIQYYALISNSISADGSYDCLLYTSFPTEAQPSRCIIPETEYTEIKLKMRSSLLIFASVKYLYASESLKQIGRGQQALVTSNNKPATFSNLKNELESHFKNSKLNVWKLRYCLDNDKNRFEWADNTMNDDIHNGKGVIYRMIDEFGNDCPYDFKNILFKSHININNYYYTFIDSDNIDASIGRTDCYSNKIYQSHFPNKLIQNLFREGEDDEISNNVLLENCENCEIDEASQCKFFNCTYCSTRIVKGINLYNCNNVKCDETQNVTAYFTNGTETTFYIDDSNVFIIGGNILANNVYQSNQ